MAEMLSPLPPAAIGQKDQEEELASSPELLPISTILFQGIFLHILLIKEC